MWQDIVLGICTLGFSYALIPQIISHFKKQKVSLTWQTILITAFCMYIVTFTMFTLKLWLTSSMNLLGATMWSIFGVQKWMFERR